MTQKWKVWIDTGGTFTDCLAENPGGELKRVKVLSSSRLRAKAIKKSGATQLLIEHTVSATKDILAGYRLHILGPTRPLIQVVSFNPASNILTISAELPPDINLPFDFELESGEEAPVLAARLVTETPLSEPLPPLEMRLGTTKGTNALLERKGANVAWFVTKGFKDLTRIGNQQRPDIFALKIEKPAPFYTEVVEIDERISAEGKVVHPLNIARAEEEIQRLMRNGIRSVAVSFLNSYKNPAHEKQVAELCAAMGVPFISVSSNLFPTIKLLPRAETAIVDAYLNPILSNYLQNVTGSLSEHHLKVMSSAGGLVNAGEFHAVDSLLSGPAGGVVGAAEIARACGESQILTLDMGGTSTDVSRYTGKPEFRFECEVGSAKIASPSVAVETVAAGGGSICSFDGLKLRVGPESAGAFPGPACYGSGGPFTITDVNLLLGRVDEEQFGIPLQKAAAEKKLAEQLQQIKESSGVEPSPAQFLEGYLQIANERMAEAIMGISTRKGYDPSTHTLLAFGGAGGQHACAIAELLGIKKIIVPFDAGLLSAYGLGMAVEEKIVTSQVLLPLPGLKDTFQRIVESAVAEGRGLLRKEGVQEAEVSFVAAYLRFAGQDSVLEIESADYVGLERKFEKKYRQLFGHWVENRTIEVESVKVKVSAARKAAIQRVSRPASYSPQPLTFKEVSYQGKQRSIKVYHWAGLRPGALVTGPALVASRTSTIWVAPGWSVAFADGLNAVLENEEETSSESTEVHESIALELFTNRFRGIAEEMGALLMRTAFSVNIKERLDFSCALLDPQGELVVNAPHIPVHLGGLGLCVRKVLEVLPLGPGDVAVTNHPGFGGSHLPDITLIAPVYLDDQLLGYVANRAHHAELGGKRPGSMPPDAKNLAEEGVIIEPMLLVKSGRPRWNEIEKVLSGQQYPTRALPENLADLNAALSSIIAGQHALMELCEREGVEKLGYFMRRLKDYSNEKLWEKLNALGNDLLEAEETLDDGSRLSVSIKKTANSLVVDFSGSAPVHSGNLNATPAIVRSAVIYVLRLLIDENIPLNEGIMNQVNVVLPEGLLNPPFPKDPASCPAVVGGNTEVSQRLVDTLIKAFSLSACSQGTMNNLLFGNENFGYYETICGGTGAGPGFHGADAIHHHMTNTRITDPEVMEWRYPVQVEAFSIRKGSGGEGKWKGGDGVVRKLRFTEPVQLTILSQHRVEKPFGMEGGGEGAAGNQWIESGSGSKTNLKGVDAIDLEKGDAVIIETPGGGGWG